LSSHHHWATHSRLWPPPHGGALPAILYQIAPASTSGANNPYGIRSWKCRTTAASVVKMETASDSPSHRRQLIAAIAASRVAA
jgi:hypothetical protein